MPRTLSRHLVGTLDRLGVPRGARIVVGVSGGADSMALLWLLMQAGHYRVRAVHVHHGLRASAEGDAEHVAAWCARQEVPCEVVRLDGEALRGSHTAKVRGLQAAAREARYRALGEAARASRTAYVAVAHHADDQVETMLMRLARGLGPDAPLGMTPIRRLDTERPATFLLRPLLQINKHQLERTLDDGGVPWVEDPGNADASNWRGGLRHRVLPVLREVLGPERLRVMARSGARRAVTEGPLGDPYRSPLPTTAQHDGGYWPRAAGYWALEDAPLASGEVAAWLRGLGPAGYLTAAFVQRILHLFDAEVGTQSYASGCVIWRERTGLVALSRETEPPWQRHALADAPVGVHLTDPSELPADLAATDPSTLYLDADAVSTESAVVRRWEPGERVHLVNAERPTRIADLLSRRAVPVSHRAWVRVVESGGHIVAVPGVGAAHRARVTPETQRVLRLTVPPVPRL